jgi:hypothetical protein
MLCIDHGLQTNAGAISCFTSCHTVIRRHAMKATRVQQSIRTGCRARSASCQRATGQLFPGIKVPEHEAYPSPPYNAKVKMSGSVDVLHCLSWGGGTFLSAQTVRTAVYIHLVCRKWESSLSYSSINVTSLMRRSMPVCQFEMFMNIGSFILIDTNTSVFSCTCVAVLSLSPSPLSLSLLVVSRYHQPDKFHKTYEILNRSHSAINWRSGGWMGTVRRDNIWASVERPPHRAVVGLL